MKKAAQKLIDLAEEAKSPKVARELIFTALRMACDCNPLTKVLNEYGFEPSYVFEYGDDDKLDEVYPSKKSVHKDGEGAAQEIWIQINPDGKMQYGYMFEGPEGHGHKYFDNLDDLVAFVAEQEETNEHSASLKNLMEKYAAHKMIDSEDCEHENTYEDWGTAGRSFAPLIICEDCGAVLRAKDWEDYEREENDKYAYKDKKNVKLNKPFRTPGGPKKFSVYVKNEKGNVVKVNFGDPNMEIKRDDPERRKNFRARHNCDNPGPKTKAKYWSCKFWSKPSVGNLLKGKKK